MVHVDTLPTPSVFPLFRPNFRQKLDEGIKKNQGGGVKSEIVNRDIRIRGDQVGGGTCRETGTGHVKYDNGPQGLKSSSNKRTSHCNVISYNFVRVAELRINIRLYL